MKISICGTGRTGAAIAFALVMRQLGEEIVLVSREPAGKAAGDAIDLAHASLFLQPKPVRIAAGNLEASAGSDIVIYTSSARVERMVTRRDFATANGPIIAELAPKLAASSPDAVFIVISNPVDVMGYLLIKHGPVPAQRVIGTGTLIDTARYRALLAEHIGIHAHDVRAYILGEHGESMVPALSHATAGGVRLPATDATILELFGRARQAGYEVFHRKGYTDYAIAACVTMIAQAIAHDTHEVMPVSTMLTGQYGISDACLSLPCVIGRHGILRVLEPELSQREIVGLRQSASTIRELIDAALGSGDDADFRE